MRGCTAYWWTSSSGSAADTILDQVTADGIGAAAWHGLRSPRMRCFTKGVNTCAATKVAARQGAVVRRRGDSRWSDERGDVQVDRPAARPPRVLHRPRARRRGSRPTRLSPGHAATAEPVTMGANSNPRATSRRYYASDQDWAALQAVRTPRTRACAPNTGMLVLSAHGQGQEGAGPAPPPPPLRFVHLVPRRRLRRARSVSNTDMRLRQVSVNTLPEPLVSRNG